mmetsp:Transcript_18855/g.45309  ORF Transcript_18855/g.45309 Transcript_18855/m.45309 type:complete len:158 (-) Transcript_18855:29-502(-)
MADTVEGRLAAAGFELPGKAAPPAANYCPFVKTGNLVFISGQLPMKNGEIQFKGLCGAEYTTEQAYKAAELCAINLIAQVREACDGDLSKVKRVVKLGGFVACGADFTEHPKVINGASDIMAKAFGPAGTHSRAAVGCSSLPFGVPVEVEGVFEISD